MKQPAADAPPEAQSDDSLFNTLIATAVDGIVVIDERGIVQVYNEGCRRLFQYDPAEVVGRNVKLLMPEPYRDEHDGYIGRYRATGEARIIGIGREVRGARKDGTTFPMYLSVGAGKHAGKRIFVGIIHDLSSIHAQQMAHEDQTRFLASIVKSSNDAILSKTLDGIIISWNHAAEDMFGYSQGEVLGKHISILFPPDRLAEENVIIAKIRAGEKVEHFETTRRRKDGTDFDISLTISPIFDASGRIVGASKTARDITERKAAEARLRSVQGELSHVARLTEMGQLSAALAHELNQPLTAVLNYMNVTKRLLAMADPAALGKAVDAVTKAGQQALRAGQIIRRLRDFVEKRESKRTIEDVNRVVEDAIALGMVGHAALNIKVHRKLARNLAPLLIDKVQIQQVLVNLMRNAAEAMAETPRRELTISTEAIEDMAVEISVCDTGPGIPDDVAQRLFQPFVTTKSGGMGIGLAISQSIVEAHGGQLAMRPNDGGGTIFTFRLPAAPSME